MVRYAQITPLKDTKADSKKAACFLIFLIKLAALHFPSSSVIIKIILAQRKENEIIKKQSRPKAASFLFLHTNKRLQGNFPYTARLENLPISAILSARQLQAFHQFLQFLYIEPPQGRGEVRPILEAADSRVFLPVFFDMRRFPQGVLIVLFVIGIFVDVIGFDDVFHRFRLNIPLFGKIIDDPHPFFIDSFVEDVGKNVQNIDKNKDLSSKKDDRSFIMHSTPLQMASLYHSFNSIHQKYPVKPVRH